MQEGLWNLSFFVDKDSILIKVWIFKNYMDSEMINPWTQVKSYHGHFEISQTTYTLYSGLNHVNYLNIIKRDHVSATVRTRLHLASGWSLDHSGA